ncbi:hypothetical protein [Gymnodinialimonas sp.]
MLRTALAYVLSALIVYPFKWMMPTFSETSWVQHMPTAIMLGIPIVSILLVDLLLVPIAKSLDEPIEGEKRIVLGDRARRYLTSRALVILFLTFGMFAWGRTLISNMQNWDFIWFYLLLLAAFQGALAVVARLLLLLVRTSPQP